MNNKYSRTNLLHHFGIPVFHTIEELSYSIGISKKLIYLLSKKNCKYYSKNKKLKKDKSFREILAPQYPLKLIQKWILVNILEKMPVTGSAKAFLKSINGIKENANFHKSKRFILQIDLKDFFTSIKRPMVFKIFKHYGYNHLIANILTNLCLYDDYLPQGGVCSPYLSNLICKNLDKRLIGLCNKRDVLYTRYADDLSFSSDNKIVLKKINKVILNIIQEEGFSINNKKTRFLTPCSCKNITGININSGTVKADKALKHKVRAMIHKSITSGNYDQNQQIIGIIAFISSIENDYKQKIINYINKLADSITIKEHLVTEYNQNKIFKELEGIEYCSLDDIIDIFEGTLFDE